MYNFCKIYYLNMNLNLKLIHMDLRECNGHPWTKFFDYNLKVTYKAVIINR